MHLNKTIIQITTARLLSVTLIDAKLIFCIEQVITFQGVFHLYSSSLRFVYFQVFRTQNDWCVPLNFNKFQVERQVFSYITIYIETIYTKLYEYACICTYEMYNRNCIKIELNGRRMYAKKNQNKVINRTCIYSIGIRWCVYQCVLEHSNLSNHP